MVNLAQTSCPTTYRTTGRLQQQRLAHPNREVDSRDGTDITPASLSVIMDAPDY